MGSGQNTAWQMISMWSWACQRQLVLSRCISSIQGVSPWLGGLRNNFSGCKYCFLIESTSLRPRHWWFSFRMYWDWWFAHLMVVYHVLCPFEFWDVQTTEQECWVFEPETWSAKTWQQPSQRAPIVSCLLGCLLVLLVGARCMDVFV